MCGSSLHHHLSLSAVGAPYQPRRDGATTCHDGALKITFRVQRLTWVTMAGKGKPEDPAGIDYQSPWHGQYAYINDYFARLIMALTGRRADVKASAMHPSESF